MKKLTAKGNQLVDDSIENATLGQSLILIWWDVFVPLRRKLFLFNLEIGMSWGDSFGDAKGKKLSRIKMFFEEHI